jgi:hypothetical protein
MLKIAPFWNQMLGIFAIELIAAVAPLTSLPLQGDMPLLTGFPAFLPLEVAPTAAPKATLPVTGL